VQGLLTGSRLCVQAQPSGRAATDEDFGERYDIFMADYEQGDIGHDLFRAVCRMGPEGIVSKHRDRAYHGGRCKHWVN
jgi:hypothetical protein